MKRKGEAEEDVSTRRRLEDQRGIKRDADEELEGHDHTRVRVEALVDDGLHEPDYVFTEEEDYDVNTGEVLDKELVRKGKEDELSRFRELNVYRHVSQEEAHQDPDGVIVDVRWVIVNKGSASEPNIRCRLVCREFADKGNRDDLFAGTPSLMTIRVILSLLAKRAANENDIAGMIVDVKGAFLYGKAKRNIYIWLPEEDEGYSQGLMGKLERAMYGTRGAPQVWQEEVRANMQELGFRECATQPGVYCHEKRNIYVVSHVDDF